MAKHLTLCLGGLLIKKKGMNIIVKNNNEFGSLKLKQWNIKVILFGSWMESNIKKSFNYIILLQHFFNEKSI